VCLLSLSLSLSLTAHVDSLSLSFGPRLSAHKLCTNQCTVLALGVFKFVCVGGEGDG
jgi:hypothetical protein